MSDGQTSISVHPETLVHLQTAAAHAIDRSRSPRLSQAHSDAPQLRGNSVVETARVLDGDVVGFKGRDCLWWCGFLRERDASYLVCLTI